MLKSGHLCEEQLPDMPDKNRTRSGAWNCIIRDTDRLFKLCWSTCTYISDSDPLGLDSCVPKSDENESDSECDEMSTTVIHDEETQFSTISDISKSECRGMSESNGRKRKHRGDGGDQASKKRRISVHWSDMDNKKITSFFKDWIVARVACLANKPS